MALIRYTKSDGTVTFSEGLRGMSSTDEVFHLHTIDIIAKKWHDAVNGNTYFSAHVILNYMQAEGEVTFTLPFQYGYGSQFEAEALLELKKRGYIPPDCSTYLHVLHKKYGIIGRKVEYTGCKKRDVVAWGKE